LQPDEDTVHAAAGASGGGFVVMVALAKVSHLHSNQQRLMRTIGI
jgi:hypothetical protein